MTRIYEPYRTVWGWTASLNLAQCKAAVTPRGYLHYRQCCRKAEKDGWCTQHHPDAQAKRDREAAELRNYRHKNSDAYKLKEALKRIEDLEEEIEELQEHIGELEAGLHF